MMEILVILRDVILVTVLSWIGVDYAVQPEAGADQQQAMKASISEDYTPVILMSAPASFKYAFGREDELFRS